MGWLTRRILIVIAVLSALLLSARLVGSSRPMPVAALFTNPDGSPCRHPCLFGAEPGRMTSPEAAAILKLHPLTRGMKHSVSGDFVDFVAEAKGVRVLVGPEARWIDLDFNPITYDSPIPDLPPPPEELLHLGELGEVILAYGAPDLVSVDDRGPVTRRSALVSFYSRQFLRFAHQLTPADYITPNATLAEVTVISDTYGFDILSNLRRWLGFGRTDRYPREREP